MPALIRAWCKDKKIYPQISSFDQLTFPCQLVVLYVREIKRKKKPPNHERFFYDGVP